MNTLDQLLALAKRHHVYNDEDSWYSCPAAPGGCSNENYPAGVCTCGADAQNAEIDRLGALLRAELGAGG